MNIIFSNCADPCACDSGTYGCSADYPGGAETLDHTFVFSAGLTSETQVWRSGAVKTMDFWRFTFETTIGDGDHNLDPLVELFEGHITSFGSPIVTYGGARFAANFCGGDHDVTESIACGPSVDLGCLSFESPVQYAPEYVFKAELTGSGAGTPSISVRIIGVLMQNP